MTKQYHGSRFSREESPVATRTGTSSALEQKASDDEKNRLKTAVERTCWLSLSIFARQRRLDLREIPRVPLLAKPAVVARPNKIPLLPTTMPHYSR